ncbi:DUF5719 family protein [Streptomyces palmae]|uniref:Secreted protein n=1 Tax=Streptomyces palmae TaxID=1701085 RepID=A0A4Z0FT59_9ACTN|nr:DUF5719 family protein [Streptomyces palmae]TGA85063.1 hypothetical protein E4099_31125 [Streptomyces palmae]
MNRTTLSLIAAVAALAAVTGVAAVAGGTSDSGDGTRAAAATGLPVERSSLVCPSPSASDVASTTYTAFSPGWQGAKSAGAEQAAKGSARLLPAAGSADGSGPTDTDTDTETEGGSKGKRKATTGGAPMVPLEQPGTPVTDTAEGSGASALTGTADGRLAPGWTVQQTTTVDAGVGRGLLGTSCTAPDTDFWFPAASTASDRQDYIHLTNPDSGPAVVDLELFGADGEAGSSEAINVPGRSTVALLLSTLTKEPQINLTVHVTARAGRVGASVQAADTNLGGDWLPASADPAPSLVLPGIPADATGVRLVAFAPGEDADLKVRLSGPSGSITPAGNASLHVKGGMTAAVDLGDVTKGEPGSLILTSSDGQGTPVVAALRITRGKGDKQETAFIPAAPAIDTRGTVADNRAKGSTLTLTAPGETAKVRVTSSAATGGGSPASETYTIKAGTTIAKAPPRPSGGKGAFAVTVERLSGGPVHAARTLALTQDGLPMFTIQTLPDDRGTVAVPAAGQDLSLLNH